jgi:hypothetical protein
MHSPRALDLAALALSAACGCGGVAANRRSDAAADAASDAGHAVHCGGAPDYFPDGAPPWVTCSCPDAGCPAHAVCASYLAPEGPRLPFGCAPVPSTCAGRATCACASVVCGTSQCIDEEAGLLCNQVLEILSPPRPSSPVEHLSRKPDHEGGPAFAADDADGATMRSDDLARDVEPEAQAAPRPARLRASAERLEDVGE